jgi:DNA-binding transcriptional regulator YdaS (Cro superfamily)
MGLKEYLLIHGAMRLAGALRVTPGLVSQWKQGVRPVKVDRCVEIELATGGQVMRWDLRPNDWWLIWPELQSHTDAPAIPVKDVA